MKAIALLHRNAARALTRDRGLPIISIYKTMPEKNVKTDLPNDDVKLKPFLGIKPGHYLACVYAIILLLILFFILLYPGISNPGSVLVVKSEPWGAAVLVDGVYREAAPCKIFVPEGRREIELRMPGFRPLTMEIDVGKKLFASALFPLKTEIRGELLTDDPSRAFVNEAKEYAAWTFTGEPSAVYQVPLSLSEGAYRLGPHVDDPAVRKSMEDTITASARFAVTRASLRDLVRAKTLLDNRGLSPSPISLLGSAEDVIGFLNDNPKAALWLGDILTGETQSALTASSWYSHNALSADTLELPPPRNALPLLDTLQAGRLRFRLVPGGSSGGNFPPGTLVDTFYIADTIVSEAAWEAFLGQNPKWQKENVEALTREGLANEEYLEKIHGAPAGVSGVSWYAAMAFCEWLSASIPPQYASWGYKVHLPTEAEWEHAAKTGIPDSAESSYWEWCEEPYVPLSFLSAPPVGLSPERPVKGGSWVNQRDAVGIESRASLPPSFCSPFVSFRPVLVPGRNLW